MSNAELIEKAKEFLTWGVVPEVGQVIEKGVESGELTWVVDPWVDNVVGVLKSDSHNTAVAVFYLEAEDFECDDEYFEARWPKPVKPAASRRKHPRKR